MASWLKVKSTFYQVEKSFCPLSHWRNVPSIKSHSNQIYNQLMYFWSYASQISVGQMPVGKMSVNQWHWQRWEKKTWKQLSFCLMIWFKNGFEITEAKGQPCKHFTSVTYDRRNIILNGSLWSVRQGYSGLYHLLLSQLMVLNCSLHTPS